MNEEFGTEYGDLELVAGTFRGVRSFRIDKMGRLTAKHQSTIWLPGENVARCLKEMDLLTALGQVYGTTTAPNISIRGGGGAGSSSGSIGSSGVWYGTTAPTSNTWITTGTSSGSYGIPQGHGGKYTVNVAFPDWTDQMIEQALKVQRQAEDAKHRAADLHCTCGFYAYFDDGPNTYFEPGVDVLGIVEGYGQVTVGSRGFKAERAKIVALIIPAEDAFRCRLVRRNYKDVPVFESTLAAYAEFPLTPNDPPGPDEDPDFWDRPL